LKRSIFAAAVAVTALVSLPFAGGAQVKNPVNFGVAAGVAFPTSDLSDITNTGWNVTGMVGINPTMIPLGIRVDVAYNSFALKDETGLDGNINFTSVTGNLVWSVPTTGVSPYLIGGAGLYHVAADIPNFFSDSDNKFGWNLGAGIKLPLSGFDTFLEARYHQVQTGDESVKYIPVTFGIMF
jgi:opacity protein-like surface antigen